MNIKQRIINSKPDLDVDASIKLWGQKTLEFEPFFSITDSNAREFIDKFSCIRLDNGIVDYGVQPIAIFEFQTSFFHVKGLYWSNAMLYLFHTEDLLKSDLFIAVESMTKKLFFKD